MSNALTDFQTVTFLHHEARYLREKDARSRDAKILEAIAKWLSGTRAYKMKDYTFNEAIDCLERQYEWATRTHRPTTAAVYQRIVTELWPNRES